MGSLFGPKTNPNQIPASIVQTPQTNNSADLVEDALKRSGGDAKAAFYLLAREQGLDPDAALKQISSMGDIRSAAMNVLNQNPQMKRLMSLFSLFK